jgi:DNA polymerase-3 subunit delta'
MMPALPWQEPCLARIQRHLELGKLPHGILLTAIEGWGERLLAQSLALRLLEVDPATEPTELAHPDLRWIVPDKAEIKVDAVRELGGFAYSTPVMGAAKVIVFEDAHLLNRSAANALLKTLEEPPSGTFVILSTCFPGRLLPTIRSRCQRFHVDADLDAARQWLRTNDVVDDDSLEQRLFANGGAPLAVAAELEAGTPALGALLAEILDASQPLAQLDDMLALNQSQVTGGWYRYLLGLLAGRKDFPKLAGVSDRSVIAFADELLWVRSQLLSSNSANARLLLGRLTSRWHQLGHESA